MLLLTLANRRSHHLSFSQDHTSIDSTIGYNQFRKFRIRDRVCSSRDISMIHLSLDEIHTYRRSKLSIKRDKNIVIDIHTHRFVEREREKNHET